MLSSIQATNTSDRGYRRERRVGAARPAMQPTAPNLQRKPGCACGGGCPSCRAEEQVQTKLRIGAPGDRYEREADRVADQVMRMPDRPAQRRDSNANAGDELVQAKPLADGISPLVQRQEAEEEEEEVQMQRAAPSMEARVQRQEVEDDEEEVQMKPAAGGAAGRSGSLEAGLRGVQGGGQPLPASLRSFFEPRFGRDFGAVRLQTDGTAAQTAQALNAQAFTLGNRIAFGAGHYAPDSDQGRRLLAHELTHVVQQGHAPRPAAGAGANVTPTFRHAGGMLQAAGDFDIVGKPRGAGKAKGSLFFEQSSETLDSDELKKIPALVTPVGRSLILNGFRSDDEPRDLAGKRVKEAVKQLKAKDATVSPTENPKPDDSIGDLDFRNRRMVEVQDPAASSGVASCPSGAAKILASCPTTPHPVADVITETKDNIDKALAELNKSPLEQNTKDQLSRFFGAGASVTRVKGDLVKIRDHVTTNLVHALPDTATTGPGHQCATDCNTDCKGGTAAQNNGTGASALMLLCSRWYNKTDLQDKATTLLHEGSHGAPGIGSGGTGTDDEAYNWEKLFEFLSSAEALENADSYAFLVRLLTHPTGVKIGPKKPDDTTFLAATPSTADKQAREAVARLGKWMLTGLSQTQTLYGEAKTAKASGWSNQFYEDLMTFVAPRFTLTAPPARPADADLLRLAAIADRYEQMTLASARNVTIFSASPGKPTKWWDQPAVTPQAPASAVDLDDAFFTLALKDQIHLLVVEIVKATPDISAALEPKYVETTEEIRTKMGMGP